MAAGNFCLHQHQLKISLGEGWDTCHLYTGHIMMRGGGRLIQYEIILGNSLHVFVFHVCIAYLFVYILLWRVTFIYIQISLACHVFPYFQVARKCVD